MRILFLVIYLKVVVSEVFDFVEYTRVAKAYDGTPCLTGCSANRECVVNWKWEKKNCQEYEVAPIFFTARVKEPNSKYCISNCGYFGESQEYCLTSKDLKWDYCSSSIRASLTGAVSETLPAIVNAKTTRGQTCQTQCDRADCDKYNWCRLSDGKWDYCAPPALSRVPVLPYDFSVGKKDKGVCDNFFELQSQGEPDKYFNNHGVTDSPDGFLDTIVDGIQAVSGENDSIVRIENVIDVKSSIERYAMVNIGDLYVPAFIKAHVTESTVFQVSNSTISPEVERKIRQQMEKNPNAYVIENLISSIIGGSNQDFNVVPMQEDASCAWWKFGEALRKWCRDTKGSADVLVVVFYSDQNTPVPKAFGISVVLRNPDRSMFVSCREKIYWSKL